MIRLWMVVLVAASALGAADPAAQAKLAESRAASDRGDWVRAVRAAGEAEQLFHRSGDRAGEGDAARQGGLALLQRGEYRQALERFTHAHSLASTRGDDAAAIGLLNNIGNTHFFLGRYLDAQAAYETALAAVNRNSGAAWAPALRPLTLINLGVLHEQLGQYTPALQAYRQANAEPSGLSPAEHGQLLSTLAALYRRLGQHAQALEAWRRARAGCERAHQPACAMAALHQIGIVYTLDQGDAKRGLAAFSEALEVARRSGDARQQALAQLVLGESLYRLGEPARAGAAFQAALDGARAFQGIEEQWTAHYGLGRVARAQGRADDATAAYREAMRAIESVRAGQARPSLKPDFLPARRDVYDAAIALELAAPSPDPGELLRLIEHTRSSPEEAASLAAVRQRLADDALLVAYWLGRQRGAAVWVTRAKAGVVRFDVGPEAAAHLADAPRLAEPDFDWRHWSRAAGALLLAGLPLQNARECIVIPDRELHRVPFEVLDYGTAPLLRSVRLRYLPSAAWLREPARRRLAAPWKLRLTAFGAPQIDSGLLEADAPWFPLPEARAELSAAAEPLPGVHRLHAGVDDLKASLAASPLLHLATHAALDLSDPNRSRILFTRVPGQPGSPYLFLPEAAALPLQGTELVTLSHCDLRTAGRLRGDAVPGFGRAFLSAGAAAAVTPLWKVADRPTLEFMRRFYRALDQGESRAGALRTAKLAFLDGGGDLSHPRQWAAFTLYGEGGPVPRVVPWWFLGGMAALVTVGLVVFLLRRQ